MRPETFQALRQMVGDLGPLPPQSGRRYDLSHHFKRGEIDQQTARFIAGMAQRGTSEVLQFCLAGRPLNERGLKIAMRRFVAVAWLLHSEMLVGADRKALSLDQLGKLPELDCTKCALSLCAKRFANQFGFHARVQKRQGTKGNYAAAAKTGWAKRRKKARSR